MVKSGPYEPFDPNYLDYLGPEERNEYVRLHHKPILKKIRQLKRTGKSKYDVFPADTWERWIDEAFEGEKEKPLAIETDQPDDETNYVELNPILPYIRHVDELIAEGTIEPQEVSRINEIIGKHHTSLGAVLSIMLYHGHSLDTAMQEIQQYIKLVKSNTDENG